MRKKAVLLCVGLLLAGYPLLILIWHPWQMQRDLSIVSVPVAAHAMSYREIIQADDLAWRNLPQALIDPSVILEGEAIIGKAVSNEWLIAGGSFFTEEMIDDPKTSLDQASLTLKQGQAAYSINADLVQCSGGTLVINEKIDVYCTIQQRGENPVVDLLIQAARIIDLRDRRGLSLDDPNGLGTASVIVLAVDQEMIPLITTALEIGKLQFYVTDRSWQTSAECQLNEDSRVLPYLMAESS